MISHIVFFTFKEEAKEMKRKEMIVLAKNRLEELEDKIPEIKKIKVGINFLDSPASFDLSLYTEFENQQDLDIYQNHPEHVKVKELFGQIVEKRALVDSNI